MLTHFNVFPPATSNILLFFFNLAAGLIVNFTAKISSLLHPLLYYNILAAFTMMQQMWHFDFLRINHIVMLKVSTGLIRMGVDYAKRFLSKTTKKDNLCHYLPIVIHSHHDHLRAFCVFLQRNTFRPFFQSKELYNDNYDLLFNPPLLILISGMHWCFSYTDIPDEDTVQFKAWNTYFQKPKHCLLKL